MKLSRRGFLVADMLVALAIVALLAAIMAATLGKQAKASIKFSQTRAAMRLAEAAMADMQTGQSPSPPQAGTLGVRRMPAQTQPAGMAWVEVTVQLEGGRAALLGLVGEGIAAKTGGAP